MNEQQLQQILTIQQAIAAAATAAVLNSILNPQQAAALASANALADSSNDIHQQQQQSNPQESRHSPTGSSSPANMADQSARIQDLLLQLQQHQHKQSSTSLPLNLNLATDQTIPGANILNPIRSPSSFFNAAQESITANSSNINQPVQNLTSPHHLQQQQQQQSSPNKKLKRHHHHNSQHLQSHNVFQTRNQEATSKSQHSAPKSHHSNLSSINNPRSNSAASASSPSSSAFMPNNVGLPRKLVRGQDVWLGRGAEQTRQILKCMWCGQSFRTLTELTQHMKITQHYTNIISQEQIVSWRQPENSETGNRQTGASKQSSQALDDNQDDYSDKFNDSEREESSFSNDEDSSHPPLQKTKSQRLSSSQSQSTPNKNTDTVDNDSNDSSRSKKDSSPNLKPLTRSKKPSSIDIAPSKREHSGRENSPASSSSSQRNNTGNSLVLGDLNEESEANKDSRSNDNSDQEQANSDESATVGDVTEADSSSNKKSVLLNEEVKKDIKETLGSPVNDKSNRKVNNVAEGYESAENEDDEAPKASAKDETSDDNNGGDNVDEDHASESGGSPANSSTSATKSKTDSKGTGETADPLSALETMVEKSFDPRLRPGVANGGILQRLGIDEEVCPPWQHINYANWYAAAAYGHPMAAALLAAGINLQNGIKLSKNATPKKNDD